MYVCVIEYCMHPKLLQVFATPWTVAHQTPLSVGFPGKNAGEGCHALLQGIFLTQRSNSCFTSPAVAGGLFTTSTTQETPMDS